jgi:hypothetical protein
MDANKEAAIIINDLDSLVHRIEALPAYPSYTNALSDVIAARQAVTIGRQQLHELQMLERFEREHKAEIIASALPAPEGENGSI